MKIQRWLIGIHDLIRRLEVKELLWTNPNPSAAFGSQIINSSSSGWVGTKPISYYDDFVIAACQKDGDWVSSASVMLNNKLQLIGSDSVNRFRNIDVTESGFDFDNACGFTAYNNWSTTVNNDFLVPQKIYGIKHI